MLNSSVFAVDVFSVHWVYRAAVAEGHSIEIETGIFRSSSSDLLFVIYSSVVSLSRGQLVIMGGVPLHREMRLDLRGDMLSFFLSFFLSFRKYTVIYVQQQKLLLV